MTQKQKPDQIMNFMSFNYKIDIKTLTNLTCLFHFPHFIFLSKLACFFGLMEKLIVKVSICLVVKPASINNQ